MVLYIGYNNAPSDGGGAQLHRLIINYCIARAFNIQYVHKPITYIGYKGLAHLEANRPDDPDSEKGFNSVLHPTPFFKEVPETARIVQVDGDLDLNRLKALLLEGKTEDIFAKVALARPIIETSPDLYRFAVELAEPHAPRTLSRRDHLDVHIHLRRGELFLVDSWRMLPNAYYISIIKLFNQLLPAYTKSHSIHVHTETLTKDVTVNNMTHGVCGRMKEEIVLKASTTQLDEFQLPNVLLHINEKPWDTLRAFQTADILVMSHSSFIIVGASMNAEGIILYHPFWHKPMSKWLDTTKPTFIESLQSSLASI
jgi:hypothetical protein